MLDLEVVTGPEDDGTAILSVADFKRHLRILHNKLDDELEDIIVEAAAKLHGADGELNRTVFPMIWRRYLRRFPDKLDVNGNIVAIGQGAIELPLPPLIDVTAVTIEDGSDPANVVDASNYVVMKGYVGRIEPVAGFTWPTVTEGPRAVSITFLAGYDAYPANLRRMLKILAAHNYENPVATTNEPRVIQVNRSVVFALEDLRSQLAVPINFVDWD